MANGFAPYVLKSLQALAGNNYPGIKITPSGFLALLLENSNIVDAKLTNPQGHKVTAQVKYKVRQTDAVVQESDNCDIDFTPVYKEAAMTTPRFAKTGFHLSMDTVSAYMNEASNPQSIGNPSVSVIREIADSIAHAANAIVTKVDKVLLGDVVWGTNVTTGNNNAKTLNIGKDTDKYVLDNGFQMLLNDAFENEFNGQLLIAGSGLMNAHELGKLSNTLSAGGNGVNLASFNGYKWYPDLFTASEWASNQIGVFAPGSIHFVDFQKYVGFQQGKIGNSTFFQIDLPVNYGLGQTVMTFDIQIKELDCPTTLLNHYGDEGTYERGYGVYISKRYGLFQTPSDAYSAVDPASGVNGALRYNVTNVCDTCEEVA